MDLARQLEEALTEGRWWERFEVGDRVEVQTSTGWHAGTVSIARVGVGRRMHPVPDVRVARDSGGEIPVHAAGSIRPLKEEALVERVDPLGGEMVQGLRKDFLTLVGNIKRVKSYDDAEKLRVGFRNWRDHYDDWLAQMRQDIESRGRDVYQGAPALPKSEVDSAIRQMAPMWAFKSELGSFPLRNYDPAMEQWWPKGSIFAEYQREVGAWDARTRKKAALAWKAMDYLGQWAKNWSGFGPIKLQTKETENINLAGFQVQLHGFEPGDMPEGFVSDTGAGLALYRKRAQAVLPLLIKKQLPIVMTNCQSSSGCDAAATYEKSRIRVTPWGHVARKDLRTFVHVMAHEMGHHIYQTVLSGEAQEAWRQFIKGGQIAADLRDMLRALAKYGDNVWSVDQAQLQHDDPILFLQFQGLYDDPAYRDFDLVNTDRIKAYLAGGGDPVVHVSRSPITGYAQKNPEEAFCEAVGRLVAYGPRTVLPEVLQMLRAILPEIRVESRARSAADQLVEALGNPGS